MPTASRWITEHVPSQGVGFSLALPEGAQRLHVRSAYQTVEVYQTTHFGHVMLLDGCIMLTERDHFFYHEMITHPALLTHPAPQEVVIIGGGDCGTLHEVLRHPVQRVTQVDIDPAVTSASQSFFPSLCARNQDPRAHCVYADGNDWIQQAQPESVDVILVDSTDPVGPGEVLFSDPFYAACWKALRPDGILAAQSGSPLLDADTLIRPMHAAFKQAGARSTCTVHFPQPCYPSGWWSVTLASKLATFPAARTPPASLQTRYYHPAMDAASRTLPAFLLDLAHPVAPPPADRV